MPETLSTTAAQAIRKAIAARERMTFPNHKIRVSVRKSLNVDGSVRIRITRSHVVEEDYTPSYADSPGTDNRRRVV